MAFGAGGLDDPVGILPCQGQEAVAGLFRSVAVRGRCRSFHVGDVAAPDI